MSHKMVLLPILAKYFHICIAYNNNDPLSGHMRPYCHFDQCPNFCISLCHIILWLELLSAPCLRISYSFSSPIELLSQYQIKTNYFQRMNKNHYDYSHSPSVPLFAHFFFLKWSIVGGSKAILYCLDITMSSMKFMGIRLVVNGFISWVTLSIAQWPRALCF